MNSRTLHATQFSDHRHAFTLIELLVVVAIMALLIGLVVPSVVSLLQSSDLTRAATMITNELNVARQLSLTENRNVEVRFYKLPRSTASQDVQYRAFRSFASIGSSGINAALSGIRTLPEPIILSTAADATGSIVSTLLDTNRSCLAAGTETLPPAKSAPYISFLFRASGGTSLAPITGTNSNWYLTLYSETQPKISATGIPANYFTAQIDPVTGRVLTYRP